MAAPRADGEYAGAAGRITYKSSQRDDVEIGDLREATRANWVSLASQAPLVGVESSNMTMRTAWPFRYDNGTRKTQLMAAMDMIFFF
jgi:hypothetical protein